MPVHMFLFLLFFGAISSELLIYGECHHFDEVFELCTDHALAGKVILFQECTRDCKFVFNAVHPLASYFQHRHPNVKCIEM